MTAIFVDLLKAFHTVDHDILIKKLRLYDVQGNYLNWFKSYLSSRKQYIEIKDFKTEMLNIKYGRPQGSILGPLFFIIYINAFSLSTSLLDPIMFADDANLFYSHEGIKELFRVVNSEIEKVCDWFNAKILSLNEGKTKYIFFHRHRNRDNTNEKKVSKNIDILYKAKEIIKRKGLSNFIINLYIHSFNGNLSWGSTHTTNLKKIASRQKQAITIIDSGTVRKATEKMEKLKILNIYKINLYQSLIFMFRVKNNTILYVFHQGFMDINHQYPTRFSQNNLAQRKIKLSRTKFTISSRGGRLWSNILTLVQKQCASQNSFKKSIKGKLLKLCNVFDYF